MKIFANKSEALFDMFFCLVFMPLLLVLGPAYYWMEAWPVLFCLACLFLYVCYFVVKAVNVPRLLIERRYKTLLAVALGLAVCNYAIIHYPLPDMDFVTPAMSRYQTNIRNYGINIGMWLMFAFVMAYSLKASFIRELYEQILLTRKIEHQRDKAQLAMFKAQISPHFLFNTLNTLYSLVIGTSQKAEDAFIKFTDILKYTYVAIDNEFVPLAAEVEYIRNYIDLQLIRLNEHTVVDWKYDTGGSMAFIPPMILLIFVENAFKYGASTSNDCTIIIRLTLVERQLHMYIKNRIMKHADSFRSEMPVGIQNCRERLQAIYPGAHSLETEEIDGDFIVDLKIRLTDE